MEKAKKRAVEGGYRKNDPMVSDGSYFTMVGDYRVLLDTEFWQALGKAEGWSKNVIKYLATPISKEELLRLMSKVRPIENFKSIENVLRMDDEEAWKYHMHQFIDHIAQEKNVDDFFNNLLK